MPNTHNKTASLTRGKNGYHRKTAPSTIDNDKEKSNETLTANLTAATVQTETNTDKQVQRSIEHYNNRNNNNCNNTNHNDDLEIQTEMLITNVNQEENENWQQTLQLNRTNQVTTLGISNDIPISDAMGSISSLSEDKTNILFIAPKLFNQKKFQSDEELVYTGKVAKFFFFLLMFQKEFVRTGGLELWKKLEKQLIPKERT